MSDIDLDAIEARVIRVVWVTDLHLEFVSKLVAAQVVGRVRAAHPDVVLIGGDTHTAPDLNRTLSNLAYEFGCPTYYVLGNHDYYQGGIKWVRAMCGPHYLGNGQVVQLSDFTSLVGVDGWGDMRYGTGTETSVQLNDTWAITDFAYGADEAAERQKWADRDATILLHALACVETPQVIVLTHVPPFVQACWHKGAESDPDFLPYFACKATGDALLHAASAAPTRRFLVLCGHTHSHAVYTPLPNLEVRAGQVEYGHPALQQIFTLP